MEESRIAISKLIKSLDKYISARYQGQLQVEIDSVGYTIYAKKNGKRICTGCGQNLSRVFTDAKVYNQGLPGNPILFIVQCKKCNESLTK